VSFPAAGPDIHLRERVGSVRPQHVGEIQVQCDQTAALQRTSFKQAGIVDAAQLLLHGRLHVVAGFAD